MKQKLLKHFSLRATMLVFMVLGAFSGAWADKETVTLWSEDFSSYSADAVPSGGSYSYACTDGKTTTKIYAANLAEGTSPELLINQNGGSFKATIKDLQGCTGQLTLTYKTNQSALTVTATSTTSTGVGQATATVNDGSNSGKSYTKTIVLPTNATDITITFTKSTSSNARLDDIVLTGEKETVTDTRTATTVTIDDAGLTNTNIYAGTAAGKLTATVKAGESAIDGATVQWESSNASVATVAEDGTVTLVADGNTTISAKYAGDEENYKPSSSTYELSVTNSDPDLGVTEGKPYTVAQAIKAIDNKGTTTDVYVKGIVCTAGSNYYSNSKLNYWISDDGTTTNRFEIYRGTGLNGAAFTGTSDIQVGDVVIVKGSIVLYNSSTYEFSEGSQLVYFKRKTVPALSFSAESVSLKYTEIASFVAPALTNTEDVAVSYSSSNEAVATVAEDGAVTLKAAGTAVITASFAGNDDFKANSASYTITVNKGDANLSYATTVFTISTSEAENFEAPELVNPYNLAVTYSSSNEDIAVVDENGDIALDGTAGTAVITASFAGNDNFNAGSATYTINVTAAAIYTATFNVNGKKLSEADFAEGADIVFPDNAPASIGGLVFQGWSATEADPTVLGTTQMGGADATFYAVYGEKSISTEAASYTLDYSATKNSDGKTIADLITTQYGNAVTFTASDGGVWVVKAYKSNGMQINKSKNASIKVPVCNGYITTIEVTLNSGAKKAIGFSENDYTGSETITYLAQGTEGTSQTLDLSGKEVNTGYIVPSEGNAQVTKIVVNYAKEIISYTNLTTTISESVSVGDAGYTTYVTKHDVSFPSGVTAYIVTEVKEKSIHVEEIADAPAGVPVIIEATEGEHALEFDYAGLYEEAGTNLLQVSDGTVTGSSTILALAKKNNVVGFYPVSSSVTIPEGKAYLEVSTPVKNFLGFEGTETGLSEMKAEDANGAIYNLAGQRVNRAQKGVFIQNGQKFVVK